MGMYDYLGGEQVKVFYTPIFSDKGIVGEGPGTWHSGGKLRSFGNDDELPLKTLYYQYPENFLIYDYSYQSDDIWIVENGKFKIFISSKELKESDVVGPVYDYYGRELAIKTTEDFIQLKNEYLDIQATHKEIEKEFFPNGVMNEIKNNYENYQDKKAEYDEKRNQNSDRFSKWFVEDGYTEEKEFGEALDCYLFARSRKDEEPILDNPMNEFQLRKNYINGLFGKNPGIIQKYTFWMKKNDALKEIDFPAVLEELQS